MGKSKSKLFPTAWVLRRILTSGKSLCKLFPNCPDPANSFPNALILHVSICRLPVGPHPRLSHSENLFALAYALAVKPLPNADVISVRALPFTSTVQEKSRSRWCSEKTPLCVAAAAAVAVWLPPSFPLDAASCFILPHHTRSE